MEEERANDNDSLAGDNPRSQKDRKEQHDEREVVASAVPGHDGEMVIPDLIDSANLESSKGSETAERNKRKRS